MHRIRERRRPLLVRTDVRLPASLLQEGQRNIDVGLINLSPAGFMATAFRPSLSGLTSSLAYPG
jgi:hypothetical protein